MLLASAAGARQRVQPAVVAGALVLALGVAAAADGFGARRAALVAVAVLLGVTLYHAAFGFASAYRRFFTEGNADGLRAQILMVALATLLFAPFLAAGRFGGEDLAGAVAPAGWQVAIGAFLFGVGMQLGGGCGSGTLYALGGGSTRLLITLVAFCAGGFWASLHMDVWQQLPVWESRSLDQIVGWPGAVALQLAILAILWALLRRYPPAAGARGRVHLLHGPWPLVAGAVALAVLNLATLLLAGHPWSVTWGLTLWGAKAALALGWSPEGSAFWNAPFQRDALAGSVFADTTSVMDMGVMAGAMLAAGLAGRYRPTLALPLRAVAAAVVGGLLMGYGARIAYGCNVGAFFSGTASLSLHGWLWIAAALPGSWLGVRLRPRFGLSN